MQCILGYRIVMVYFFMASVLSIADTELNYDTQDRAHSSLQSIAEHLAGLPSTDRTSGSLNQN